MKKMEKTQLDLNFKALVTSFIRAVSRAEKERTKIVQNKTWDNKKKGLYDVIISSWIQVEEMSDKMIDDLDLAMAENEQETKIESGEFDIENKKEETFKEGGC